MPIMQVSCFRIRIMRYCLVETSSGRLPWKIQFYFVSGQNFHRPKGQINHSDTSLPVFLLPGDWIWNWNGCCHCKANSIGHSIPIDDAESYVFGLCLLNDWSARDIQRWEYVPLGPFLSKIFYIHFSMDYSDRRTGVVSYSHLNRYPMYHPICRKRIGETLILLWRYIYKLKQRHPENNNV